MPFYFQLQKKTTHIQIALPVLYFLMERKGMCMAKMVVLRSTSLLLLSRETNVKVSLENPKFLSFRYEEHRLYLCLIRIIVFSIFVYFKISVIIQFCTVDISFIHCYLLEEPKMCCSLCYLEYIKHSPIFSLLFFKVDFIKEKMLNYKETQLC